MDEYQKESYLMWLCNFVGCEFGKGKSYWVLLRRLHSRPYYWNVELDRNRAEDGIALRLRYASEDEWGEDFRVPCSCLEMLVAFAMRIDDDILYEAGHSKGGDLFWKMLRNLGLTKFHDKVFDFQAGTEVSRVLDRWLDREIDDLGNGSIFKLKTPKEGFATKQVWDQMQIWLSEGI